MLRKLAFLGIAAYAGRKLFQKAQGASDATTGPGHRPTDLSGASHPDGSARADDHFRPDPHASVAAEDKESLRPATIAAPAS